MTSSVDLLRAERRRKLQVRESFRSGLDRRAGDPRIPWDFYLACADYLVAGQRRLIDQDRRLVDILGARVEPDQGSDRDAMEALRTRLDLAEHSLADFSTAVACLRRRGPDGWADFEAASRRFLDVLVNVLGARSHSLRHLTSTLLTEADWQVIANITPEFLQTERIEYQRIAALAPAGLEPEHMAATGPPAAG